MRSQAIMNQVWPTAILNAGRSFQGAPRIAPIAVFVFIVHFALILWLILATPAKTLLPKPKPRVVVQTVQLATPKEQKISTYKMEDLSTPVHLPEPVAIEEAPQAEIQQMPQLEETRLKESQVIQPELVEIPKLQIKAPPKAKEKEKTKPVPKKATPQKIEKKKAAPKKIEKKATPKETATPKAKETAIPKEKVAAVVSDAQAAKRTAQKAKQQELLARAQESIAKIRRDGVTIDANQKRRGADLKIPQLTLATVATEEASALSVGELSYRDELAGRLKLLLKLPEYGSVKLKLTLQRSGKVFKVAILSAASAQNRAYVEKMMPTLQFPPFGNQFGEEPEYTFTITLNNDF
ncbi:MAG: hypothetical protein LLG04_18015 [Parachlamydia sp.]|nr:hypothetical protein [Parachlamydia sp.]